MRGAVTSEGQRVDICGEQFATLACQCGLRDPWVGDGIGGVVSHPGQHRHRAVGRTGRLRGGGDGFVVEVRGGVAADEPAVRHTVAGTGD